MNAIDDAVNSTLHGKFASVINRIHIA